MLIGKDSVEKTAKYGAFLLADRRILRDVLHGERNKKIIYRALSKMINKLVFHHFIVSL